MSTMAKTTKPRRVDMSKQLSATLQQLRTTRKCGFLQLGTTMPAWVFLTPDGNPVDGDNLRHRVFYRLMERAELRRIRFHDLRHTFASLLIQQGESPVYVQEQLGHSSIQVTVDVYGHLIPGANRDAVDRLDAHPTRIPGASETDESDDDFPQVVETNGAGERTRTADLLITNQLLYQLSYAGAGGLSGPPHARGVRDDRRNPGW